MLLSLSVFFCLIAKVRESYSLSFTNIAREKQISLYNPFFFKWITGITDKKCKNLNSRS